MHARNMWMYTHTTHVCTKRRTTTSMWCSCLAVTVSTTNVCEAGQWCVLDFKDVVLNKVKHHSIKQSLVRNDRHVDIDPEFSLPSTCVLWTWLSDDLGYAYVCVKQVTVFTTNASGAGHLCVCACVCAWLKREKRDTHSHTPWYHSMHWLKSCQG